MLHRLATFSAPALAGALFLLLPGSAPAQDTRPATDPADRAISTAAERAWQRWQSAMTTILEGNWERAESIFGELLEMKVSALRVALMAERTVQRTGQGGAVLLLEDAAQADRLAEHGRRIAELLEQGREQMNEADDGWYFSTLGRFDVAHANFQALADSAPDPVALLELADRDPRRTELLIQLLDHPVVGPSAARVLALLQEGERRIRSDPARIMEYIERLGGPPRGFENAVARLKESGEYAVPFMIQYLRDPARQELLPAILRAMPELGRAGLNPLVIALEMDDQTTRRYLIQALGQMGYAQAVPYLLKVAASPATPPETREAVEQALRLIQARGTPISTRLTPAQAFLRLAEEYYDDDRSLAADARLEKANVWYWRDGLLVNVEVPTPIFNEIMCLRCCEESLRADPDGDQALALWVAANFRREAQLPPGTTDPTRPADDPGAGFYARACGAGRNLLALARAIDDRDRVVALGVIEALDRTAGPAILRTAPGGRFPLGEALSFPDRLVRIRAALALAHARPVEPFHQVQNLMPVVDEALRLHSSVQVALLVDPDQDSAALTASALRAEGYEVLVDASLLAGLEKARREAPRVELIVLASDITRPELADALTQLRAEVRFADAPVIVLARPADAAQVREIVRTDPRAAGIEPIPDLEGMRAALSRAVRALQSALLEPAVASAITLEMTEALRDLALASNPVFALEPVQPSLIGLLRAGDSRLRLSGARLLGLLGTPDAQEALAAVAFDAAEPTELRVAMFEALAEAGKRRGNQLTPPRVRQLVETAEKDAERMIRGAAAQALGALNVPGNPASAIIRNQYRG